MTEIRTEIRDRLLYHALGEAKNSAGAWWDGLSSSEKGKVASILGFKPKAAFSSLSRGIRSEIDAYHAKHKGKIESR